MLLCNITESNVDLNFVDKVRNCALEYNSMVEAPERIPLNLVLAQAILESDWGKSRFATQGNNLFGVRALSGEEYIKSKTGKKVKKYHTWCDSVNDYMELLTTSYHYEELQEELFLQFAYDEINIYRLVDLLDKYAEDKKYKNKLKDILKQLEKI